MASSGTNALSQRPGQTKGYAGKRAAGRAAMRAPGPAVAPNFNDEQVSVAKTEVPFAQFAGQVCCPASLLLSTLSHPATLPPFHTRSRTSRGAGR